MSDLSSDDQLNLVVDGGGTKTDCCILRTSGEGVDVVGLGHAGSSNPVAVGFDSAVSAIALAASEALAAAPSDIASAQIVRAAFALAGTLDDEVRLSLEQRLAKLGLANRCRVFPDVLPIVLAASPEGEGAALIAGTGSVSAVRHKDGRLAVTGGWGYLLGDEGSGFAIGREAIRLTLAELETGATKSPLSEQVQASLGANSIDQIKRAIYQQDDPRRRLASLAELVLQAASSGDTTAEAILTGAASDLSELLAQGLTRLDLPRDPLQVAISGGLMSAQSPLRAAVVEKVEERFGSATICFVANPLLACQRLVCDEYFKAPLRIVT
ncbi:MAG: N-acetylglucosamine kinase [Aeoliella sp.]